MMIKIILCIYALSVMLPILSGILIAAFTPGRKLSPMRTVLSVLASAAIDLAVLLLLLSLRFGAGGIAGTFKEALNNNIIYQDVQFLALSGMAFVAFSIFSGFFLRRLLYEDRPQVSRAQENMIILSVIFSMAFAALSFWVTDYSKTHIKLKELHGDGSLAEKAGMLTTIDFVSIENRGACPVELSELYLSDREKELKKYSLQGYRLEAGQELPLFLDNASPFEVGSGETVYLSDEGGRILDKLLYDPDSEVTLSPPVLSEESGFYTEEFLLSLSLPEGMPEDTDIFYTLDGSFPTQYSDRYVEPVRVYDRKGEPNPCREAKRVVYDYADYEPEAYDVDRAFVIRAAAYDKEGHRSEAISGIYFIGDDEYRDKRVISLMADYESLFGLNGICTTGPLYDAWYQTGMAGEQPVVNFWQSGRAYEAEGCLQFLDCGEFKGEQEIGLRVFGGSKRDRALKPFSVYSRKSYSGSDSFSIDFFGNGRPVHSIALRDGRSDAILQKLSSGRNVASQPHVEVSVFLNGEHWYDTFACEKYSPAYFYEHKGIAENNIIIVKEGKIDDGVPEDEALYGEIYGFLAEHDLADPDSYAQFCNIVDVQSYIEYLCANLYGLNIDQDEEINRQLYRARKPVSEGDNDGRWRFSLYDMDVLDTMVDSEDYYEVEEAAQINPFTARITENSINFEEQTLFKALKRNEEFCARFIDTFNDMMDNDFSPENVEPVLTEFGAPLKLRDFFAHRKEYMTQFLYEEFSTE